MAESNEDENNDVQMKEICVIPIDQPGHKPVTKKMSQAFFFAVSSKIGNFANQFLDTVLQCCPTIFGRFSHPDAHYFCRFLEFGRGGAIF